MSDYQMKLYSPDQAEDLSTVKKELAPNLHQTVGVILSIDGCHYVLSMDVLQEMNKYHLPKSNKVVYSHFPMVDLAAQIWNKQSDEDADIADRHVISKDFDFASGAKHLCPEEKNLSFTPIEIVHDDDDDVAVVNK